MNIKYRGQLGNNLFQYALARIIAEHRSVGLPAYGGKDKWFPNAEAISGARPTGEPVMTLTNHRIDLPAVLALPPTAQVAMNGFFQRYEYYQPHVDRIRKWYRTPALNWELKPDDVAVHVRRSTFRKHTVPLRWYDVALAQHDWNNIYVFGAPADLDKDAREHLAKYNPIYREDSAYDSFRALQLFENVIHSQSTFCWWATFLSERVRRNYMPLTKTGYWRDPAYGHDDYYGNIALAQPPETNVVLPESAW